MKKLLAVFLVLAFGFVGLATAQHRGGYSGQRGGYNNHGGQHSGHSNGYNGGYQHGGQRYHGGYGWVAPVFIGAGVGATYLLTQPYYEPPVVYYEPLPRVVVSAPQSAFQQSTTSNCHKETRKVFDEKGTPLGEQLLLVCPVTSVPPPTTTQ